MKKLITFFLCVILLSPVLLAQESGHTSTISIIDLPGKIENHPEQGALPFNAPCSDCVEDLSKRTGVHREFYKKEDGSRTVHIQQSLGAMNYKDADGYWRTIDPTMQKENESVYAARTQPSSVVIDFGKRFTSLNYAGKEFRFNKNISLSHISGSGVETSLGEGNWSHMNKSVNYTQTIFTLQDFYPGIDLQFITSEGTIESSFIIRNKQQFTDGWLVLNQELEIPEGLKADNSAAELAGNGTRKGMLLLKDDSNQNYFYFRSAYAYDAQESRQNNVEMPYLVNANQLRHYVPVQWLNDPSTVYPVVIDPTVTTADSLSEYAVRGSGYTSICDTLGCNYFLNNFPVPANCEVTAITTWFGYYAGLPCVRQDGGFSVTMTSSVGSCESRHMYCIGAVQGLCFFYPAQLLNTSAPLFPCVPSSQCSAYTVDFKMQFRRCNQIPIGGCDSTCIFSYTPWIMQITGQTSEITGVSSPQTICQGNCTNIAAANDGGVEPYTYLWQPGNLSGNFVNVCPDSTTTYYLTVTDTCGNSDTISTTVSVIEGQGPGFTISPNDSVCGATQMTFTANGNDPDSLFAWYIACQSSDTISDTKIVNYAAPAVPSTCTVTMAYELAGCNFLDTDTFYVVSSLTPSVSIAGSDTACTGDSSAFTAVDNTGGANPDFQWYLNGAVIPGADSSTYTSNFANGDVLSVIMTSNDSCSLGATATDTVQISIVNNVVPSITIHTNGPDTLCSGSQVIFNSSVVYGGTNPKRYWYQNGVLEDSAAVFITTVYFGDEIVVKMISNFPCAVNDTAVDTSAFLILPSAPPEVDILQTADTICSNDTITFSAQLTNVVIPPSYRWTRNGNFESINPSFSSSNLLSGDIIVVRIITNNPCGQDTAYDTTSVVVNPILVPGVSVIVSQNPSCAGDDVMFTATPVNGGVSPDYQWYVNGLQTDTGSAFFSNTLSDGDSVSVNMQSSSLCALPPSVSNFVVVNVLPNIVPGLFAGADDDTICIGDLAVFTAVANGGVSPTFQWFINGNIVAGETAPLFATTILQPGDSVSVEMYPDLQCADPDSVSFFIPMLIENCLGLKNIQQSFFSLHPNPATEVLNIEFSDPSPKSKDVFIIDALGQTCIELLNTKDTTLKVNLSNIARAIYFVKVVEGENEYLGKLVVQ